VYFVVPPHGSPPAKDDPDETVQPVFPSQLKTKIKLDFSFGCVRKKKDASSNHRFTFIVLYIIIL
jgi:hypothetical protein